MTRSKFFAALAALGLLACICGCDKAVDKLKEKAADKVTEKAGEAAKAVVAKASPEAGVKLAFGQLKTAFEKKDFETIWAFVSNDMRKQVMQMAPEVEKAVKQAKTDEEKKEVLGMLKMKDVEDKVGGPQVLALIAWTQDKMGKGKEFGKKFVGASPKSVELGKDEKSATVKTSKGDTIEFVMEDGTWRRAPDKKP
ncbi:MAG: hypothetical protein JXR96_23045 [Deltaproteobacteria bacterium]|nr:hypothetical protein [Deltaproteobacteria bacterium]